MSAFVVYPVLVKGYLGATPPKGKVPCLDYYSYPGSTQRQPNAPIVRVWGSTPAGQKVTVHVHGFFPYFYARPITDCWELLTQEEFRDSTCNRIKDELESALRAGGGGGDEEDDESLRVRAVLPASMTPFYGYHATPKRFVRIELWRPDDVRRAGAILHELGETPLQPHESHISFETRFMVDFGIYGLAPLSFSAWRFRYAPTIANGKRSGDDDDPAGTRWRRDDETKMHLFHKECRGEGAAPDEGTQFSSHSWCSRRCTSDLAIEIDVACAAIQPVSIDDWTGTADESKTNAMLHFDSKRALPSLQELWEREARRLKRDNPNLADDELRDALSVSQVWLAPSPLADDQSSPPGSLIPRGIPCQLEDKRGMWERALKALRATKANRSVNTTVGSVSQLTSQGSVEAAEADAVKQEQEQLEAEEKEFLSHKDCPEDIEDDIQDGEVAIDDAAMDEYEEYRDDEEVPAESPLHRNLRPSISTPNVARELNFSSQASSSRMQSFAGDGCLVITPKCHPPSRTDINEVVNQNLHYSKREDAAKKLRKEYGGCWDNAVWNMDVDALPAFDTAQVVRRAFPCCSLMEWRRLETAFLADLGAPRRAVVAASLTSQPPTRGTVARWAKTKAASPLRTPRLAQTQPSTVLSEGNSSVERGMRDRATAPKKYHCRVSVLALEVLAICRRSRVRPDPEHDAVVLAVWRYREHYEEDGSDRAGCVLVGDGSTALALRRSWKTNLASVDLVNDEPALLRRIIDVVCTLDPDVIVGWDMERESFAYLADRAVRLHMDDLVVKLSRVRGAKPRPIYPPPAQHNPSTFGPHGIEVVGRMSMNAWREVSRDDFARMRSYTLEAASLHLLKKKIPKYSAHRLYQRFSAPDSPPTRAHAILHVARRCATCLAIVTQLNTIGRAAEVARLFGLPLDEALFRGSQHRVEAVILRVAKPPRHAPFRDLFVRGSFRADDFASSNQPWFAFCSPTRSQVANQQALEDIAMTLEPWSNIYTEPVAVLDFRSLYPSIIIAYNLCFSTLICRLNKAHASLQQPSRPQLQRQQVARQQFQPPLKRPRVVAYDVDGDDNDSDDQADDYYGHDREEDDVPLGRLPLVHTQNRLPPDDNKAITWERLGVTASRPDAESAAALIDAERFGSVYVAPNGGVFAPVSAREGVLPKALREILAARELVKSSMKRAADAGRETERRAADARQLALKLLANVIYGYCSASFSGRQPCAELADAIVSTGRETLRVAIDKAGGAARRDCPKLPVKYGDTDSLFVELRGMSRSSAIEWGKQFAKTVSDLNPPPVLLKFEKVYDGCLLQAKKNYGGIAYTSASPESKDGEFECKGIAPMRRDKCTFVAGVAGEVLETLLRTRDISAAKAIFVAAVDDAYAGRTPLEKFVVRQEAKLGSYKRPHSSTVATIAAALNARGARVLSRERVAFVFARNVLGKTQQVHKVLDVDEAIRRGAHIDADVYVRNVVNTLNHVFSLIGINVERWKPRGRDAGRSYYAGSETDGNSGVATTRQRGRVLLTDYFSSDRCELCHAQCAEQKILCEACSAVPSRAVLAAQDALRRSERKEAKLMQMCVLCAADPSGGDALARRCPTAVFPFSGQPCDSTDCAIAFQRRKSIAATASAASRLDAIVNM